ncbi:MAG: class I SAM-dependent methyltransferase [Gammaproteobacteria bacterium]|nr:class I SAM-dependent methyltransferase [Gammaproteobacteria bacterium]
MSLYAPANVEIDEMDWDAYAKHYDTMCDLNPSYHDNLLSLATRLPKWNLSDDADICDLGAGTGNYIQLLNDLLPGASFTHIDFDAEMNELAAKKYEERGITSVKIVREYAQQVKMEPASFDLILCVNALYAIAPQDQVLKKVRTWLKDDGRFFVIDFGRKQRTLDWAFYLFRESLKHRRVGTYVKALLQSREVIKQNRRSTKGQATGRYWTHSTSQFGDTLVKCGFEIEELTPCYRGYADLAICRKR